MAKKLLAVCMVVLMLAGVFAAGASASTLPTHVRWGYEDNLRVLLALDLFFDDILLPGVPHPGYDYDILYHRAELYFTPEAIAYAQNATNVNLQHDALFATLPAAQANAAWDQIHQVNVNALHELLLAGVQDPTIAQLSDVLRVTAIAGQGILQNAGVPVPFQFTTPDFGSLQGGSGGGGSSSSNTAVIMAAIIGVLIAVAAAAVAAWFFLM